MKAPLNFSLTADRLRECLRYEPETGLFFRAQVRRIAAHLIGKVAGAKTSMGYIRIRVDGITYRAHRLAWLYEYGRWPVDVIDHINGVKSDNRIANLREATASQNTANQPLRRTNTSGFRGVKRGPSHDKWECAIRVNGKSTYLGSYRTPEEASVVYLQEAKKLFGDFVSPSILQKM